MGSDTGWVTLDSRSNQAFGGRSYVNDYPLTNTTAYQRYRLKITKNNGSTAGTALTEIFILDG